MENRWNTCVIWFESFHSFLLSQKYIHIVYNTNSFVLTRCCVKIDTFDKKIFFFELTEKDFYQWIFAPVSPFTVCLCCRKNTTSLVSSTVLNGIMLKRLRLWVNIWCIGKIYRTTITRVDTLRLWDLFIDLEWVVVVDKHHITIMHKL